jgi:hypothetical protein
MTHLPSCRRYGTGSHTAYGMAGCLDSVVHRWLDVTFFTCHRADLGHSFTRLITRSDGYPIYSPSQCCDQNSDRIASSRKGQFCRSHTTNSTKAAGEGGAGARRWPAAATGSERGDAEKPAEAARRNVNGRDATYRKAKQQRPRSHPLGQPAPSRARLRAACPSGKSGGTCHPSGDDDRKPRHSRRINLSQCRRGPARWCHHRAGHRPVSPPTCRP